MSGAHLDEWQRRSFDISSGSRSPEQTAEAYRAHVLSIQYAWASARLSPAGAARLLATYAERYAAVLDSDDPQTGLNNYAEGALHLARSQRNHSDRWQSALTAQSMQEMLRAGGGGGGGALVAPGDADISVGPEGPEAALLSGGGAGGGAGLTAAYPDVALERRSVSGAAAPPPARPPASGPLQQLPGPSGAAHSAQSSSSSNPSKRKNFYSSDGADGGRGQHGGQAGPDPRAGGTFKTAHQQLIVDQHKQHRGPASGAAATLKNDTPSPSL
ncbi:Fidgetin-like protein 1 [Liparis tanakae]|uniref:Fidgetin-like protein 1 n=1 Tax=Liparis tanakae TaxID=230148 RepID=A0A4Z2G0M9_9TELE|nr:Fidgetin-like protein 1 [Liparis tanakae]